MVSGTLRCAVFFGRHTECAGYIGARRGWAEQAVGRVEDTLVSHVEVLHSRYRQRSTGGREQALDSPRVTGHDPKPLADGERPKRRIFGGRERAEVSHGVECHAGFHQSLKYILLDLRRNDVRIRALAEKNRAV